ncbi:hypothetical protein BHM03_00060110 [Ensete ventricosum]|nr:hypothetical protein BHM03_00060110 [Ensete ventricosum]
MDRESRYSSPQSSLSSNHLPQDNSSFHHSNQPSVQCLLCRRVFSLEAELNDGFEAIHICRECKIMVLDDNHTNLNARDVRRIRRQRRDWFRSSVPIEDLFFHRYSRLINLANHNNEAQSGGDIPVAVWRRVSYYASRNRSLRRQSALSDNDSDALDQSEYALGETDSNFSFGGYGGDSDASLDRYSLIDRQVLLQHENESYVSTDTDIDPMHAGLDQWNSDGEDDEDGEWEEADWVELSTFAEPQQQVHEANVSPSSNGMGRVQDGAWFQLRIGETPAEYSDVFADFDESDIGLTYVGNPGDYVDARGLEELLEQLAETDSSRRGAPPAAASFMRTLPSVVVSKHHQRKGTQICAVCKDPLLVDTEAKQLPCRHLYHPSCILPWLNVRNSCPVCRYELPTDDPEYEEAKRNLNQTERHVSQTTGMAVETYDTSSEFENEEAPDISIANAEHLSLDHGVNRSSGESGRGGWLFLAAAPIVSIVGIALIFWLRKPPGDARIQGGGREQHLRRSQSTSSPADRNRRWWSIF